MKTAVGSLFGILYFCDAGFLLFLFWVFFRRARTRNKILFRSKGYKNLLIGLPLLFQIV